MYGDCVASTSRLAIQDDWDPLPSLWTFPVSDCRYESNIPDTHPKPPSPVRSHPTADVPSVPPLAPAARSSYSSAVPVLKQLSPGVWTDGKDTLLSAALPEVQELLAAARSRLSLPKASSELIFTLAALEVFYKPADPAHWLFWSDDKKSTTADVVTRIALHQPPLIISPVAWNGKPEYLSILANHHGSTWRQFFESQSWYTIVVPPKPSTPPRQLNLRKRRVVPGAFRDPSRSPGPEDVEGDDSGPAMSRAASPDPSEDVAPPTQPKVEKRPSRARAARTKPKPPPSPSPLSSPAASPENDVLTLSPEQEPPALAAEVKETATRSKRKATAPSRSAQSIESVQETVSIPDTSLLLGPGQHPSIPLTDSAMAGHSRTRSTSTDSSAKTAVASDVSRSASVASGRTAVEPSEASTTKKRKTLEDGEAEYEDTLDLADVDEEGENDDVSNAAPGRNMRARRAATSTHEDDAILEKAATARAGASTRNRKRVRKV